MPTNPYDPNFQLYQTPAAQPQMAQAPVSTAPVAAPGPSASGLHFIQGIANLGAAAMHFFSQNDDDDETGEEEAPRRNRFQTSAPKRVGKGSCCRRPTR